VNRPVELFVGLTVRIRASLVSALALTGAGLLAAGPPASPLPQSDLDAFMAKVMTRRDENWKKLQQYILDERTEFALRGPTGVPVWGDRREYTWFIREGHFIRSPVKANGVTVDEADRRKYEDNYLRRVQAREKREAERERQKTGAPADDPAQTEAATLDAFLAQAREPEFVNSAYFMKFKFDEGRALVGREPFAGTKEVLRVEYYPTRLYQSDDPDRRKRDESKGGKPRNKEYEETLQRLMNKVALITLWIEPASLQIVKYTFDNVNFDFFPGAWMFRIDELKAAMAMNQPFKDKPEIWLPQNVQFSFMAMLAIGQVTARFNVEYHDYREATTAGRIKKAGER
jgi:hypothetical protein